MDFLCPITHEVMFDPVVTSSGHSYERSAIALWLRESNIDPKTGVRLTSKLLFPNHVLRSAIADAGLTPMQDPAQEEEPHRILQWEDPRPVEIPHLEDALEFVTWKMTLRVIFRDIDVLAIKRELWSCGKIATIVTPFVALFAYSIGTGYEYIVFWMIVALLHSLN
jgi:hypothetical protein